MEDKLLQILNDYATPLNRAGKSMEEYLSTLYQDYLRDIESACDISSNPTLGEETCGQVKSKIDLIQKLSESIVATVRKCEAGDTDEGKIILFEALNTIKGELTIKYTGEAYEETYYRIRKQVVGEEFELKREELFHIPNTIKENVAPMRFSIAEYPCLYLSSQYQLCWYECRKPERFAISAFDVPQDENNTEKVVDIGEHMRPLASQFSCDFYNERNNPEHLKKLRDYLTKQLVIYPLRAACSVIVEDCNCKIKPEYFVPQLLMQWLLQDDEFDGIRYETVTDYPEAQAAGGHNLVFVSKNFDADGYAENLRSRIRVTTPVSVNANEIVDDVFDGRDIRDNPYVWGLEMNKDFEYI
jgi:hypothetical protein